LSEYVGTELEVFEAAHNWKRYMLSLFRDHISGRVLEVGAGIGGTTRFLSQAPHREWLCLEPDARLAEEIRKARASGNLPQSVQVKAASTLDLALAPAFDTILYIDVLEHLEDDAAEMRRASALLAPGGALIVFGPAMPWLYSPFDAAIGHFRRYTRESLSKAAPAELQQLRLHYVDSLGVLLSLGNRLLLRNPYPKREQIELWDRKVVPISRRLDPLVRFAVGKSILGVWRKP
jgi:SAM-dependent methyltransferase